MSKIIIDNQTDLPDKAAILKIVECLVEVDNGYRVTQENNVFTLKESNQ